MDDLLSEFLTEAAESIAGLDEALLKLERSPDDAATVGLIFRLVHTIKGTCGFLGLARLEKVAHAAENVLGMLREGAITGTPTLITAVLTAVDAMKLILDSLASTGEEPEGNDAAVIATLNTIFQGQPFVDPLSQPHAAGALTIKVEAGTETLSAAPINEPSAKPVKAIVSPGFSDLNKAQDTLVADGGMPQQSIRVSVGILENLMTLVSELVLTRNQLLQITRNSKDSSFSAPVQRLSQITSDLQEGIVKTRMQPIGSAWSKLPRVVRDLARDLNKSIELRMVGAETEIDRQVLELVRDPLTHMVRNSADHGLETIAERRAAGKPERLR